MPKGMTYAELMEGFEADFLKTGRARYLPATDSWLLDGRPATVNDMKNAVVIALERTSGPKVLTVIQYLAREQQTKHEGGLVQWVNESAGARDSELRKWVALMQRERTTDAEHEAHVWALKQWMWQVKRHAVRRSVTWHVLPIFWSAENGTGKSFNVKRFYQPMGEFARTLNVSDLNDKFSSQLFSRTYVGFFDEFAGADKVNLGVFKSLITGRALEGRMMYSESGFHAPNRMSFIATSNLLPPHGLEDESGARRLWSIHCAAEPADKGNARGQALDAIDFQEVWASVDVDWPSIYDRVPRALQSYMERQRDEHLRTADSFETFCHEFIETGHESDRTRLRSVVAAYKRWCNETAHSQLKTCQSKTAQRLEHLGYNVVNCQNRYFLAGFRIRRDMSEIETV